jgi:nuclease-like protein
VRYLAYVAALVAAGAVAFVAFGFGSLEFLLVEVVVIAGLSLIDRIALPRVERWSQGAGGEESVGRALAELGDAWAVLHDVGTGRGNIDHVVIGPAGLFTIETKSHRGRIRVDNIDRRMLGQAWAQRKWLEEVSDAPVEALLVFSAAYLDRPLSRQRGVLVMPGRLLVRHLVGRERVLSPEEVKAIQLRVERVRSRA